jgi:hypothetical protein
MKITKLIWIVAVVAIGVFFVNKLLDERTKRDVQRLETQRVELETKTGVSKMAMDTNAVIDWDKRLSKDENYRMSPVLTIELEQLWQGDRPILFIGSIKDISSGVGGDYLVVIERGLFTSDPMFETELRLSLHAPKALIDPFLAKHPKLFADSGFNNGVAVVAKVQAINTSDELREDDERVEVKTGLGELLEIQYTGDVFF